GSAAWRRLPACEPAVVARQLRSRDSWRRGRRTLLQYGPGDAARLFLGRPRLRRGCDRGLVDLRAAGGELPPVPRFRRGDRLRAGCTGYDDCARDRAAARPGLCRCPPSYALSDRDVHGRARGASPGAPSCSAAGRAATSADVRRLNGNRTRHSVGWMLLSRTTWPQRTTSLCSSACAACGERWSFG